MNCETLCPFPCFPIVHLRSVRPSWRLLIRLHSPTSKFETALDQIVACTHLSMMLVYSEILETLFAYRLVGKSEHVANGYINSHSTGKIMDS